MPVTNKNRRRLMFSLCILFLFVEPPTLRHSNRRSQWDGVNTESDVLWRIIGAPEELELLQDSKSKMDLSLIYPKDPKQLPTQLAGVQWPPKSDGP